MRLVFVLYAEDRDLLPSRTDGRSRALYDNGYSVRGLYAKLAEDAALNPDTMDERRGGWGRVLALFRLIHGGHPSHIIQARGGKLFDPDVFPFLEGRAADADKPAVMTVSDGCILRVLEGLMTLEAKGRGADRARERLSYRTLDVEQIGSVYETVMGFTVEQAAGRVLAIKAGKNNRTPVFVNLDALIAKSGKDRVKYLKEDGDRALTAAQAKGVEAAKSVADMVATLDSIVDERASPRKRELPSGTPILQPTDERRSTGSHCTPRSLTEPIVRYALEPAFERLGPDATPEQILDLKVCDPAMGSGAFLVEACRALAARLVTAWARWPEKKPVIPADEDEELHARRLNAQRCLYGVDKNPLATDLAKLSLWLATLARDHEFTFLDHALKSGDSLVGLR
jgi:MmeI, DNA-methyltransferase domain